MKITLILVVLFSSLAKAQTHPVKSIATLPIKLTNPSDSLQYTLGVFLGQWITNNGFTINNPQLFRKGMDDLLLNKTLLVDASTVSASLDAYQKRLISERSSQQEKLLFENVRGKAGVGMLPSGVGYMILKTGGGIKPWATDSVVLNVKGYLPDGKLFEDTYAKKRSLIGSPETFIQGMNEVLQIMPLGSTWRVFIPSALGYGERGIPGLVPAYSALIFDVELVNIIGNTR
ncbi:MAG: FKBP-type peptidyl-prolyl cis-trans isomerase [Candidatus Pedobacter colombiensis]|uniref:Peptidyl-prolyl cis-trans isomerase n=1 Tax=Candidatus Pedobacter colombiensis TaxID=3121371 RepID=A0AAJ5W7Z5_9SPHI|nr:FKBP-type peptidyl-prolyl cis-trans isomerase [Pedobacter sp.]WEK20258.1 MAG: FKBP-type peptidyl-prolyl cis-trans isomerase [Pedobacter sp.]